MSSLIINIKMCCDLGNLGDVRIRARTGMLRTLRFILTKMGKTKRKKGRGSEKWDSSTQRHTACLLPMGFRCGNREVLRTESSKLG